MIDFPYKKFLSSELDPAEFYRRELDKRLRAVCDSYRGKKIHATTELEPLWDFVVTLALARLFNVSRQVYDHYDEQINRMDRDVVVDLTSHGYELFLNDISAADFLLRYFSLAATHRWLADNICLAAAPVPEVYRQLAGMRAALNLRNGLFEALATPGSELLTDFTGLAGLADLAMFEDCFRDRSTSGEPKCHE